MGDLKADPANLMARYFDAHLYYANWGSRRLMLRLPKQRVELKTLRPYFTKSRSARLKVVGDDVLLDLGSDSEAPEEDVESPGSLAALAPLRAELMRGDLRPAYLAWLLSVGDGEVKGDTLEPPLPPGLAALTAPQAAMVEFLRIDIDLVAAASADRTDEAEDDEEFQRWVLKLAAKEKDSWLRRAAAEPDLPLGGEPLRAFRSKSKRRSAEKRRSAGRLRTLAKAQRAEREKSAAARLAKTRTELGVIRQPHLAKLARDVEGAWSRLEKLIAANGYVEAIGLATDLRDLAILEGKEARFAGRFAAMRERQSRRRGFFDQWKRANARGAE